MVIFIELMQYAKNLGGKSRKNLVEHQIIKMRRKFNSIICHFFAPLSQDNAFSLLQKAQQQNTNGTRRTLECPADSYLQSF